MQVELNLKNTPPPQKEPTSKLISSLTPTKLRRTETGEIAVVMKAPTLTANRTYIFFGKHGITWCGEKDYIDRNFEFIGPLGPDESVVITGNRRG